MAVITVLAGDNMALIQFVGSWKCKNKEKFMKIAGAK
jgi:hypothetical protein